MANLETLELTINANAASATEGIKSLTTSLIDLGKIVASVSTGLERLNLQIRILQSSGMKISAITKGVSGSANKNPITQDAAMGMLNQDKTQLAYLVAQEKAADFVNKATQGKMTSKQIAETAMSVKTATERYEKLAAAENENVSSMSRLKNAFRGIGEKVDKVGSRFGRLASTMLMRTAIKALIKNFSEAWNAAYNFSKKMGGSFAKSIDNIKGSFQSMSINIVRAFAPLAQVVAPIISVIASGIKYLTDAIIALLKVIGIASDLFGATAENIAAVGGASGSATKDVLASFDELNVLDKNSGGGGGGSGGSNFLKDFTEQIETVKVIVGEALLAVGLILAFMGHPAVGIGLAAIGAASIAGTIATKWGSLTDEVKGQIAEIMVTAGTAMLALGLIIGLATAKWGLGIALMIAGAANMVAAVTLSWGLSDEVKKNISKLMTEVGVSLLAIGAVLAFSGGATALGIAMMAAGGLSLVGAAALNWNSLKEKIVSVFDNVKEKLVKIWEKVSGAVTGAWDAVKTWAEATWSKIGKGWANIKAKLSEVWDKVKLACVNAWAKVSNWANMTWDKIKQAWEDIKNGLKGVWEVVSKAVSDAWTAVGNWINATWENIKKAWEDIKDGLAGVWESIGSAVSDAWTSVTTWISAKWEDIKAGWEGIKEGFAGIWEGIQKAFNDVWDVISKLWNDPLGSIKKAWDGVVTWFQYNIVKPLQQALPGIFGEWKEPGEGDDPITALIMTWGDGKTGLGEAIKQLLAVSGVDKLGTELLRVLKESFPTVKAADIIKITDWKSMTDDARKDLITALIGTFGREGLASVRSQFPNIKAEDIISVTEWKNFTLNQKFAFLDAVKSAFGSEEVIKAAKAAGIDLGALVTEGMKSKDESIKRQAEMWNTLIKQGVNNPVPQVSVTQNQTSLNNTCDTVKKTVEGVRPTITVNKIEVPQEQKNNVVNELGGLKPTVKPNTSVPETQLNNLKSQIEGVNPTVTANVKAGSFSEFRSAFIKSLSAKLNLKSMGVDYFIGQLTARANGGFVDGGDIFIANENGVPEMVGTFGNRTAVANTDQIVSGIASGVAQANEEQNALLRQQNSLLRGILEKDASVRIGASAALGRVARQSLDMYSGLVGG